MKKALTMICLVAAITFGARAQDAQDDSVEFENSLVSKPHLEIWDDSFSFIPDEVMPTELKRCIERAFMSQFSSEPCLRPGGAPASSPGGTLVKSALERAP